MATDMKVVQRNVRNNIEKYFGTKVDLMTVTNHGMTVAYLSPASAFTRSRHEYGVVL